MANQPHHHAKTHQQHGHHPELSEGMVDQNDQPITEDYLGYPVTVQFQVQVRVEEEGDAWSNWQNVTDTFL